MFCIYICIYIYIYTHNFGYIYHIYIYICYLIIVIFTRALVGLRKSLLGFNTGFLSLARLYAVVLGLSGVYSTF